MLKSNNNSYTKLFILFCIGSFIYMLIEIIFRGYTHWTMGILGGICFLIIGILNNNFKNISIFKQCLIGSSMVTCFEFFFGIFLNLILKLNIWDYSNQWGNILGQICPLFTILWLILSFIAIILDDFLRWLIFNEKIPKYKWF